MAPVPTTNTLIALPPLDDPFLPTPDPAQTNSAHMPVIILATAASLYVAGAIVTLFWTIGHRREPFWVPHVFRTECLCIALAPLVFLWPALLWPVFWPAALACVVLDRTRHAETCCFRRVRRYKQSQVDDDGADALGTSSRWARALSTVAPAGDHHHHNHHHHHQQGDDAHGPPPLPPPPPPPMLAQRSREFSVRSGAGSEVELAERGMRPVASKWPETRATTSQHSPGSAANLATPE